jgi:hypothetical protein
MGNGASQSRVMGSVGKPGTSVSEQTQEWIRTFRPTRRHLDPYADYRFALFYIEGTGCGDTFSKKNPATEYETYYLENIPKLDYAKIICFQNTPQQWVANFSTFFANAANSLWNMPLDHPFLIKLRNTPEYNKFLKDIVNDITNYTENHPETHIILAGHSFGACVVSHLIQSNNIQKISQSISFLQMGSPGCEIPSTYKVQSYVNENDLVRVLNNPFGSHTIVPHKTGENDGHNDYKKWGTGYIQAIIADIIAAPSKQNDNTRSSSVSTADTDSPLDSPRSPSSPQYPSSQNPYATPNYLGGSGNMPKQYVVYNGHRYRVHIVKKSKCIKVKGEFVKLSSIKNKYRYLK